CSNMFYSSPTQLLLPGRARMMGDGWENARRRDDGNDHVTVRLAARATLRRVEIDTSYFVGNAAGWARLSGIDARGGADLDDTSLWRELVPRTRLQPDTRQFFRLGGQPPVTHVRLDVYPDGGLARLRIDGEILPEALREATVRWLDSLPDARVREVLTQGGGLGVDEAGRLTGQRPFGQADALPPAVLAALLGDAGSPG
ncbi:MAG: hypothetical protein ACRDPG_07485, partial [Nocardioidaceae bacterium]